MNFTRRHFWRLGAGLLATAGMKAKAIQPVASKKPSKAVADFKVNFFLEDDGTIGLTSTIKHPDMADPVVPYPAENRLTEEQRQRLITAVKDVHDYVWLKHHGYTWS